MNLVRTFALKLFRSLFIMFVRASKPVFGTKPSEGPVIVSLFEGEPFGLGVAGGLTVSALKAAGVEVRTHNLRKVLDHTAWGKGTLPVAGGGVWLIHCNAPEALTVLMKTHPKFWLRKHRIGYWAYELPRAPRDWVAISNLFHEIWVPSKFVAIALGDVPIPVRIMGHPVDMSPAPAPDKARFEVSSDRLVLCAGDLRSSLERKNIAGAISIYCHAFPEPTGRVSLIIKLMAADLEALDDQPWASILSERSDIHLRTDVLSPADMRCLIASSDVFLSPHRSEGFGLLLAEIIACGGLPLATKGSGNMDFMRDLPALLIPSKQVPVPIGETVYGNRADSHWAEPDQQIAAEKLARLIELTPTEVAVLNGQAIRQLEAIWQSWSKTALGDIFPHLKPVN